MPRKRINPERPLTAAEKQKRYREALKANRTAEEAAREAHPDRIRFDGSWAIFEVWVCKATRTPEGQEVRTEGYCAVGMALADSQANTIRQLVATGGYILGPEARARWRNYRKRAEKAARLLGFLTRHTPEENRRSVAQDASGETAERVGEIRSVGGRGQSGYEVPVRLEAPYPSETTVVRRLSQRPTSLREIEAIIQERAAYGYVPQEKVAGIVESVVRRALDLLEKHREAYSRQPCPLCGSPSPFPIDVDSLSARCGSCGSAIVQATWDKMNLDLDPFTLNARYQDRTPLEDRAITDSDVGSVGVRRAPYERSERNRFARPCPECGAPPPFFPDPKTRTVRCGVCMNEIGETEREDAAREGRRSDS